MRMSVRLLSSISTSLSDVISELHAICTHSVSNKLTPVFSLIWANTGVLSLCFGGSISPFFLALYLQARHVSDVFRVIFSALSCVSVCAEGCILNCSVTIGYENQANGVMSSPVTALASRLASRLVPMRNSPLPMYSSPRISATMV